MKRFICLIVVMVLSFSLELVAFADSAKNDDSNVTIERITEEKFLLSKAEEEGISYEEAKLRNQENTYLVLQKKNNLLNLQPFETRTVTDEVYYVNLKKRYMLNKDVGANIEAKFKVLNSAGSKEILDTTYAYTRRSAGASIIDWIETGCKAYPSDSNDYPVRYVEVLAAGYFEFEISSSASVGFSLSGFNATGTQGSTKSYMSDTLDLKLNVKASSL